MASKYVLCGGVLVFLAAAVSLAQPPLTRTPAPAPGYTNVVVSGPVSAAQEGTWIVKSAQEGPWTMRVADVPLRTIAEQPAPSFIRAQKAYMFAWGSEAPARYMVTEVRPDGWLRTSASEGTRRRDVWINSRQLALVEELP